MDPRTEGLAAQGFDVSRDTRVAARQRRRRRLVGAGLALLLVAAVPVGLALIDEVQERRVDAALPGLAQALADVVRANPAQAPRADPGREADPGLPYVDTVRAWDEDPPVDGVPAGEPGLVDPASDGDGLLACVRLDPWLGGERDRCVPLADPDAEPDEWRGGGVFYALGAGADG